MTAPYYVVSDDPSGAYTYRVIGPGLASEPETVGSLTFNALDDDAARAFCEGLCRAFRAGERAKQDAIKRALGI